MVSKLVINSIFESDSTFKVHVSSSRSVVDTASFLNIEDAEVKILDNNGNIVDVLNHINNGFYMGQTYPEENKTYNLEVKHPNYSNITSLDSLPAPININRIDTPTVMDPINGDRIQRNLNFDDKEKETADLYVYRLAEKKAIKIGNVTRVLKESSVDCILNISQTNYSFSDMEEGKVKSSF